MQRWTFQYSPAKFPAPPPTPDYDFVRPQVRPLHWPPRGRSTGGGWGRPRWWDCRDWTPRGICRRRKMTTATRNTPSRSGSRPSSTGPCGTWAGRNCSSPSRSLSAGARRWAGTGPALVSGGLGRGQTGRGYRRPRRSPWGWLPPWLVHEGRASPAGLAARLSAQPPSHPPGGPAADAEIQSVGGGSRGKW